MPKFISDETLRGWFAYHPPASEAVREAHERVRRACEQLGLLFNGLLPEGPDKTVALRAVRNAMLEANACIAVAGDVYHAEECPKCGHTYEDSATECKPADDNKMAWCATYQSFVDADGINVEAGRKAHLLAGTCAKCGASIRRRDSTSPWFHDHAVLDHKAVEAKPQDAGKRKAENMLPGLTPLYGRGYDKRLTCARCETVLSYSAKDGVVHEDPFKDADHKPFIDQEQL